MRNASTLLFSLLVVSGCGAAAAKEETNRPTCDAIMLRCHPFDVGLGEIHACHEFSEADATTEAECVAMHDHCFAVCTAPDAGVLTDANH